MLLDFITWTVDPVAFSLGSLHIRWYGILWALGLWFALLIEQKLYKNEHCPADWSDKMFLYMVLGVIIGARLGHCWFYEWHEAATLGLQPVHFLGMTFNYRNLYIEHPWELLKIWEGGLSSHGGALGLIVASILLSHKHFHTGIVWIFDRLVIGVCITGACIRLGNLFNSEIYGNPTTMPWGFLFALNGDTQPCHPTQIYEMLYCLVGFVVTWLMYWKGKCYQYRGLIFGVFLEIIFVTRFILEFIKFDQEAFEANFFLNMGQILSIPFILWGIGLIIYALKKGRVAGPFDNLPTPESATVTESQPLSKEQAKKLTRRQKAGHKKQD